MLQHDGPRGWLVARYFGSKGALFDWAVRSELSYPDLTGATPTELAERLVDAFFDVYADGNLTALLRSAATSTEAADLMRRVLLTRGSTRSVGQQSIISKSGRH